MGFLRVFGTTVLSIILFFTLSVFSVAFLLNSTVLNRSFMNTQIDKLDISAIAHDTVEKQIKEQLPQGSDFIDGVILDLVGKETPLIKDQLHNGINEGYAYFLGDKNTLSVNVSLTAIKKSLKDNIWQSAVDYLTLKLNGMSSAQVDSYVGDIAAQIPDNLLPSQLNILPQNLRTTVVKEYIKSLGGKGVFNALSFGLDVAIESQVKAAIEQYFGDTINDIEDTYTLDESTIDASTMQSLQDVRTGIDYFKAGYVWLIFVMIVLAGLIFLINWKNIRASVLSLGIDLLIFGVLDLAGVLLVRILQPEKFIYENTDVAVSVQNWINGLVSDITGIMMTLSIAVLVIGAGLVAASFFIQKPETVD